jgi:2EXR family
MIAFNISNQSQHHFMHHALVRVLRFTALIERSGPRTIVIVAENDSNENNIIVHFQKLSVLPPVKAITKVPALLHTNVEAREVAAKPYELAFHANLNQRPVWFDFSIDHLCLGSNLATGLFFENTGTVPDPAVEPRWQLGNMPTQLRYVILPDRLAYSRWETLFLNFEALETVIVPREMYLLGSGMFKRHQTATKFLRLLTMVPDESGTEPKLKGIFMAKEEIENLKQMVRSFRFCVET